MRKNKSNLTLNNKIDMSVYGIKKKFSKYDLNNIDYVKNSIEFKKKNNLKSKIKLIENKLKFKKKIHSNFGDLNFNNLNINKTKNLETTRCEMINSRIDTLTKNSIFKNIESIKQNLKANKNHTLSSNKPYKHTKLKIDWRIINNKFLGLCKKLEAKNKNILLEGIGFLIFCKKINNFENFLNNNIFEQKRKFIKIVKMYNLNNYFTVDELYFGNY